MFEPLINGGGAGISQISYIFDFYVTYYIDVKYGVAQNLSSKYNTAFIVLEIWAMNWITKLFEFFSLRFFTVKV